MVATDYRELAKRFGDLPDDAILPDPAAAIILGISIWTLKRRDPVRRIMISPRRSGRRAGDIRALARGEQSAT